MTPEELQEVVAAVIAALKTNGKTIDQLTAVTALANSDNLEVSGGKKISFGKLKEIVAADVTVSAEEIKGYVVIESTDDLPEDPTQEEQMKGYILDTMLYIYVGTGGDTLDGKYRSIQLKGEDGTPGAQGPKGDKGDSGVDLGEVVLVNDLTTGGEGSALSAEMGKELGDMLIERTESQLSGTTTENAKITNTGLVSTGNASYGSVTNIDVSSITSQVHVYGVCSGYNKSAYAFYDNNNTLLLKGGSFTGETSVTVDDTITVPTGAKTLRLSQNRGTISMYATRFDESNKVDKLVADVNALQVTFTTTGRRLYGYDVIRDAKMDATGAIVSGNQAYGFVTKMAIPSGKTRVRIYGNSGEYNKTLFAFFSGSTMVQQGDSYAGNYNVTIDKIVDVPNTAETIFLSQNSGGYGSLYVEWAENTTQAEDVEVNLNDLTNFNSLTPAELMSLHSASQARAEGRMIFEDDFMGDKLNENIWGVDEGQFLNRNWYVNAKENVWVENSILHISATRTNRYGKVAVGQITTKGKFDFCGNIRIEGKLRMPTIQAFWPAFWTWGTDTYAYSQGTGDYAELDILELFGSSTSGKISCNLWTGVVETIGSNAGLTNEQRVIGKNDGNWHIYTADIYDDFVILSFDGVPFVKYTLATEQRQYIYTMRQYILISAQIQGNAQIPSTIDGATLECDWVHVYALGDDDIMPTAFSVPSTLSMSVGDKVRLTPTFTDGIMRTTTYDIVDESIVGHGNIVNSELVAKAAGTTDVYVITKNRKTAKCTVTVS